LGRAGCGARSKQLPDAIDQGLCLEGLRDVTVRSDLGHPVLVESLEGPGQEEHGDPRELRVALDRSAQLVAVHLRHSDVCQDQVRPALLGAGERVGAVVDREQLDVLVGERDAHDLLDRDGVVR
jgi:hypothetical protein